MKKFITLGVTSLFLVALTALPAFAAAAEGEIVGPAQLQDLLYRIMNFAVFAAILYFLLRKPIPQFFKSRRESIASNLEFLEMQARNLEEQSEAMNKQIAGIAAERDAIIAYYERMGQKESERIIAEARSVANTIIQKAQVAMEQEVKTARQTLMVEIIKISTQTASDLIQSNINKDDQKRLTSEFMDQVEQLKMTN